METDECLDNNGGCWRDDKTNITACKVVPAHLQQITFFQVDCRTLHTAY